MAPIVRDYTVILTPEPEARGYSVTVLALPEVATQGETVEEALAMAREAIELSLSQRLPAVTAKAMVRVPLRSGFEELRQKGARIESSANRTFAHSSSVTERRPQNILRMRDGICH
jgi:predicted RNase H-like HicB family nuclease